MSNKQFSDSKDIELQLRALIKPEKSIILPRFFKTGKGEYGEGDKFLGVVVPDIRGVAKANRETSPIIIKELLESEWHECRMCGLLMMVDRYKRGDVASRSNIVDLYLSETKHINNWDLVDLSAPYIIGEMLKVKDNEFRCNFLDKLATSSVLWEQRIAVVSTVTLIRANMYSDTLRLCKLLMCSKHDLMHKAMGWMLREIGKRDKGVLVEFLEVWKEKMPRTMLRYAIEKFSPEERHYFMGR